MSPAGGSDGEEISQCGEKSVYDFGVRFIAYCARSVFHSPHRRRKASWKGCKLLERTAAAAVSPEKGSREPESKLNGDGGGDDDNLGR